MMLNDRIRLSYPWIKIKNEMDEAIYKLSVAEDEEEAELFLFKLYVDNKEDLEYFSVEERDKIMILLKILMMDTRRHMELIQEMVEQIKLSGEAHHGS